MSIDQMYSDNADTRQLIAQACSLVWATHKCGYRYRTDYTTFRGVYATVYDIPMDKLDSVRCTLHDNGYAVRHRVQPDGLACSVQIQLGNVALQHTA